MYCIVDSFIKLDRQCRPRAQPLKVNGMSSGEATLFSVFPPFSVEVTQKKESGQSFLAEQICFWRVLSSQEVTDHVCFCKNCRKTCTCKSTYSLCCVCSGKCTSHFLRYVALPSRPFSMLLAKIHVNMGQGFH